MLQFLRREITSIHAAALLVGAAGLLSRLLGLIRDRLLAAEFGASRTLDIYYAAFQIPDFLYTLFLVGAGSAAILPIFLELWRHDRERAERFIGGLLTLFSTAAVVLSAGVAIFAPFLSHLIVPGFDPASRQTLVLMTRIMMLSPLFLGLSNIFSSVVQAERRFVVFALTSIFYNFGIIFGILVFVPLWGSAGLAWGVALGAFLHMLVQVPTLRNLGLRPRFGAMRSIPELRRVFSVSVPRVLALSLDQIVMIILVSLGSLLAAGNISVFRFADNIRYIPIGIFGVSYAIAAFPKLTEAALSRAKNSFISDLNASISTILFWVVPLAVMIVLLRAHIVRILLGAGEFSWNDTRLTAAVLAIFSVSILCQSLTPILLRAFYAIGNTRLPFIVSLFTAAFTAISAPFFMTLFTSGRISAHLFASLLKVGDIPDVGVLGLAVAFALGTVLYVILLWLALAAEARKFFGAPLLYPEFTPIFRTVFSALMAGVAGYGILHLLSLEISLSTFWGVFIETVLTFVPSMLFYGGMMYMMGSPEIEGLILIFRRKMFRGTELPAPIEDSVSSLK